MKFQNVAIIGVGRVGGNLACCFFENGFSVVCLIDVDLPRARNLASQVNCQRVSARLADLPAAAEIIFITTSDNLLEVICQQLSELPLSFENKLVLHCSGALNAEVLDAVRQKGAMVASMHPVQTFIPIEFGFTKLEGVFFGIEGDAAALEVVRSIVQQFGGKTFEIPAEKKDLYHAACVIASNYLLALEQMSALLFAQLGSSTKLSSEILTPLQEATLENIQQTGPGTALTGPIVRGDLCTIEKHLEIIQHQTPVVLKSYVELGRILLHLCKDSKILDTATINKFEQLFKNYSEK